MPVPAAPPKKKRLPTWALIFGAVALLCCGGSLIAGIVNTVNGTTPSTVANRGAAQTSTATATESTPAADAPTSPAPPPPPPAPAGPATTFGTGTYEVGVDIKAGTYTCTATERIDGYWQRSKDASGELESIIANDNIDTGAKAIVKVNAKEFFKVNRLECVIRS